MKNKKLYVAEYATDKINGIKENPLIVNWIKTKIISTIKNALDSYYDGFITVDEAMSQIANAKG